MKRPIILLDCDGPLADFTGAYLEAFFYATGLRATHADVDRWAIHECDFFLAAARGMDLEPAELRRRVDMHVVDEGFCARIKPHAEALAAVAQIAEVADVYVVTSPWDSSPTWMYERLHWVANHFPMIGRRRVIQSAQKHLVRGDVFVDDKLAHVEEWARAWPSAKAILFDMHHNRGDSAKDFRGGWDHAIAACHNAGKAEGESK